MNLPVSSGPIPCSWGRCTTLLMLWVKMSLCNQDVTIRSMPSFMRGISREHILYVVKSLVGCPPNPDPFRLVESRYDHKRISFLSARSPVTVLKKGSAILCIACVFPSVPYNVFLCRLVNTGESKAWPCVVYLKDPVRCIGAQRRWSLGSCAI